MFIIALRLPRILVLHPEVPAAALLAVERIEAHQLGELEEVGHPPRLLQPLVE